MLLVPQALDAEKQGMARALEKRELGKAIRHAAHLSPGRVARILREAPADTIMPFLQALNGRRAGHVLGHLPPETTAELLLHAHADDVAALLSHAPVERTKEILTELRDLDEAAAGEVVARLRPHVRDSIRHLASYPEGSAGAAMTPRYLAIGVNATIGQTLEAIQSVPHPVERTGYVYVVDDAQRPVGVISLRDLIRDAPDTPITDVMTDDVVAVHAGDPALEAARTIRNRRFMMLPVMGDRDELLGVITLERAMEILNEEVASQFVRMGGASREESFYTPPMEAVRGRLPWMGANVFLNLGAVSVVAFFEDTIAQVAILAAFIPMITDMGGNVGIQALSVSIRSIALGEARLREFWRATRKEVLIGLVNGLALGALFAMIALAMHRNPVLGLVAGAALATNVFVAGVVGGTLPFLIKRLGKDPAMMTGPILTTITDITGVAIYLGLSTLFLAAILA